MEYIQTLCTGVQLLNSSWASIHEWYNYHELLEEKLQTLRTAKDALEARELDVNIELIKAEYQFGLPRNTVQHWLRAVKNRKSEVQVVWQKARKRRYLWRSRFLRFVDNNIQRVTELTEQGIFPDGLLIDVHDERGNALPAIPVVGETTIATNLRTIQTWLIDDYTEAIGIYGMGGVGKTTFATLIHNWLLSSNYADHVYWVTVSQEPSIHILQNSIARCIDRTLQNVFQDPEEYDTRKRAAELSKALERRKKFVLILDDMWEVFPPEEIGIPIGDNKGKLIVISRSLNLCRRMNCQEFLRVEPLSTEEAWDLFTKKVWSDNVPDEEVENIARSVVEKCSGLPLAIVVTARTMRGVDDIHDWRNVISEFREPVDLKDQLFKPLKFSYDRLRDEKLQQCFLYCALFPEDYKIPRVDLITYWIAEGLLDEWATRTAKFDRGHVILNKLENVCLLESVKEDDGSIGVKMHDLIRDMALKITEKENRFTVLSMKYGRRLLQTPNERGWSGNLERVCLHGDVIQNYLSILPYSPGLLTMLLQHNYRITEIRDPFLVHIQSLRVLDLSYMTNLKYLPNSIFNLKSLRGLLLNYCLNLEDLPSLAELKELRELFLHGSGVHHAPEGLGKLVNLKCLDLSMSQCFRIPTGLIDNLSHLQCLRLDNCMKFKIRTGELKSLIQLEMLGMHFQNEHDFNSYVNTGHWQRLSHYRLQIRDECVEGSLHGSLLCRQVSIRGYRPSKHDYRIVLPTNIQELSLFHCVLPSNLLDFSPSLENNACRELKRCQIQYSRGIEHLWSTTSAPHKLQILMIYSLPDLTSLFKYEAVEMGGGPPEPPPESGTFSRLKLLIVVQCHELKYLFTAWLVSNCMQNLQMIHVIDCSQIKYIIIEEEEEEEEEGITNEGNSILTFGKLQTLKLEGVPQLKSIRKRKKTMVCPFLQNIEVYNCPKLKRLSLSTMHLDDNRRASDTHPNPLMKISGEKEWWDLLEWDNPQDKSIFQHLFSLLKEPHFTDIQGSWLKDLTCYEEV